jgi:hypothetical protein
LANRGAKSSALYQTGVLTMAQITGLRETGTRINDRPVAVVNLHIAGPGFAFDTQKRVTVDLTKQAVITARKLVVVVDPNTRDFVIDWQASGLICGVVPAQFTSVEDNRTYDLSGQASPLMEILQIYKTNNIPFSGNHHSSPLPSGSQTWRNCTTAARSRRSSTPRHGRKSSPNSNRPRAARATEARLPGFSSSLRPPRRSAAGGAPTASSPG